MVEQYTNFATTTLDGAIDNAVTSLVVMSYTGFPSSAQYRIVIDNELLIVTAGTGTTTWTVTRGAEGTTAASHLSGAVVSHVLTAASLKVATQKVYDDATTPKLAIDAASRKTYEGDGTTATMDWRLRQLFDNDGRVTVDWGYAVADTGTIVVKAIKLTGPIPDTVAEGQLYYDTATHHLLVYNGSVWKQCDN